MSPFSSASVDAELIKRVLPRPVRLIRRLPPELCGAPDVFLTDDADGNRHLLMLVPLAAKERLDTDIRVWQAMRGLLNADTVDCAAGAGSDGRHYYVLIPAMFHHKLNHIMPSLTLDGQVRLLTDLSIVLGHVHGEPVDRPEAAPATPFEAENTLWQIAAEHRPLRSEINKLSRIAAVAAPFFGSGRQTRIFAEHAAGSLSLNRDRRLCFPLPPRLGVGDPWLDLIRHCQLFDGHYVSLRELLINVYFELSPPPAFFHTTFLCELNRLAADWLATHRQGLNPAEPTERLRRFAAQFEGCSPIPLWFDPPAC